MRKQGFEAGLAVSAAKERCRAVFGRRRLSSRWFVRFKAALLSLSLTTGLALSLGGCFCDHDVPNGNSCRTCVCDSRHVPPCTNLTGTAPCDTTHGFFCNEEWKREFFGAPLCPSSMVRRPDALPQGAATAQLRALSFELNQGQTDRRVKFLARSRSSALFLTSSETVLAIRPPAALVGHTPWVGNNEAVLRLQLIGANQNATIVGRDELPGKVNHYHGNDRTRWHSNIPTYARIEYENVYPGINQIYYGQQDHFEYDLIVAPGADPSHIRLAFKGAQKMELAADGDLILHTNAGDVRQHKPVAYQVDSGRREVAARYVRKGKREVGIQLAQYNHQQQLMIDPIITWSRFLGADGDVGSAIAVDASGQVFVTGTAVSADFPTEKALQPASGGGQDAFVMKLDASGRVPIYSTYLGGSGDDAGTGIAVDAAGKVYVSGRTTSTNFPTKNPFQVTAGGNTDAFVAVLDPQGATLAYSTYLGGSLADAATGIAVDSSGAAYVVGQTDSINFPTQTPFQVARAGGVDAFVAKLDPSQSGAASLSFSTYLGGSLNDSAAAVAVDGTGLVYVTGETSSTNFPRVNALASANRGLTDAFVAKLNPALGGAGALLYSTYLGGSGTDAGTGVAVGDDGRMFITGRTTSGDFPLQNAYQSSRKGGLDAFVTTMNPAGTAILYATFLGGSGDDVANGIGLDGAGSAWITGSTASTDFPVKNAAGQPNAGGKEVFVARLDAAQNASSSLLYSMAFGGARDDFGNAIAVGRTGGAYITGTTDSADFPIEPLTLPALSTGSSTGFVLRVGGSRQTGLVPHTPTEARFLKRVANDVSNLTRGLIKCGQRYATKSFKGQEFDFAACTQHSQSQFTRQVNNLLKKSPECLQAGMSPELAASFVEARLAQAGSLIYCNGTDPLDPSGRLDGRMPPDAATQKTEDRLATETSKLVATLAKCYEQEFQALAGSGAAFDNDACVAQGATAFLEVIDGLAASDPTVPQCVPFNARSALVSLKEALDNISGDIYCSGDQEVPTFTPPPTPTVTPAPTITPTIPVATQFGCCGAPDGVSYCFSTPPQIDAVTCAGLNGHPFPVVLFPGESCSNGHCSGHSPPPTMTPSPCGNHICEAGENANNCPTDCSPVCGNGVCEPGEACVNFGSCTTCCCGDCGCGGVLGNVCHGAGCCGPS